MQQRCWATKTLSNKDVEQQDFGLLLPNVCVAQDHRVFHFYLPLSLSLYLLLCFCLTKVCISWQWFYCSWRLSQKVQKQNKLFQSFKMFDVLVFVLFLDVLASLKNMAKIN